MGKALLEETDRIQAVDCRSIFAFRTTRGRDGLRVVRNYFDVINPSPQCCRNRPINCARMSRARANPLRPRAQSIDSKSAENSARIAAVKFLSDAA